MSRRLQLQKEFCRRSAYELDSVRCVRVSDRSELLKGALPGDCALPRFNFRWLVAADASGQMTNGRHEQPYPAYSQKYDNNCPNSEGVTVITGVPVIG